MQDIMTFHIPKNTDLLLRACGDEALVYNCASGETHLLDKRGAALLDLFVEKGQTGESLAKMARELNLGIPEEDFSTYLDEVVKQFLALHLIEETGEDCIEAG